MKPINSSDSHGGDGSLRESIASVRPARRGVPLDKVFLTVGALCLPLGTAVIILGWYGAAHTGHVYEQNDYLISGGILGLGLILIGCFFSFGFWMTRQIRATESGTEQALRALSRLEEKLSAGARDASLENGTLVVTERGSMVHRPACRAVVGKKVRVVDRIEASGLRPCAVCEPWTDSPTRVS